MAVDWGAIMSEAEAAVSDGSEDTDADFGYEIMNVAEMAASDFISELRNCIDASGALGDTAKSALTEWKVGTPVRVDTTTARATVEFAGDPHRDSLAPDKFAGVDDIVALLNDGYNAGGFVYGTWHGDKIRSRKTFGGAKFIESAMRSFEGKTTKNYSVLHIERTE